MRKKLHKCPDSIFIPCPRKRYRIGGKSRYTIVSPVLGSKKCAFFIFSTMVSC
jgi:hypothetical protein